jgi:magnesium chelatase subunit D
MTDPGDAFTQALRAAALLAVDPRRLGGTRLRALPGPARDGWLACLREALPAAEPLRRLPASIDDERLLGGLDLAETLRAGRPIARRGVLAEADGGIVIAPLAERLSPGTAARLSAALDEGSVRIERDGIASHCPARVALVLLDEGRDGEGPPAGLLDRLAFSIDLSEFACREAPGSAVPDIAAARARLGAVEMPDAMAAALAGAAVALGIESLRAPLLALAVARAAAALDGAARVGEEHAAEAVRLVLVPRATRAPAEEADEPPPEMPDQEPSEGPSGEPDLSDRLVEAARAALPADLLASLRAASAKGNPARARGEAGPVKKAGTVGRPAGSRRGEPRGGARLDLVATLRAAAPWQPLRRDGTGSGRVEVRRDDFRIGLRKPRVRATAIVAVDASGSSAFNRLAEAKGAVELLLAQAYVRRDRVALLAFRRMGAEILLEPTRSLVRAKRSLAGLPGGGGTPLAAGIEAAAQLAGSLRRRGDAPTLVLLTDGGANVCRSGETGRAAAAADALAVARMVRGEGLPALVIDISPRGQPLAREVADAMAARYLPLPRADAAAMSAAVRLAMA